MDEEGPSRGLITLISLIFLLFILQMVLFANSFAWGYVPILGVFCYLIFFMARDSSLRKKEFERNLHIKDRKDIRISFWR